jgi:ATP-dependent DNA helicase RecG
LELIQKDPYITADQLGDVIEITRRAIVKQINKLKEEGRLKRIGPDKGGSWEVLK